MVKSRLSSLFVALAGAVFLIFLAGLVLPSWQGEVFSGEAKVIFEPSLFGRAEILLPEFSWGWEVPSFLPLSFHLVVDPASLEAGSPWSLALKALLSLLGFVVLGAVLLGVLFRSRLIAVLTLASVVVLLFCGFLMSLLFVSVMEPRYLNKQSEAIWKVQQDLQRPVRPVRELYVPGQELVIPGSPYYGGEVVCRNNICAPIKRDP